MLTRSIADTVRVPYIVIAFGLLMLGIAVALHAPAAHHGRRRSSGPAKKATRSSSRSIWSYRHTVLGALGIFLYVGVEVGLATDVVHYFSDSMHGGLNALSFRGAETVLSTGSARWWAVCWGLDPDQDQVRQVAGHLRLYRGRAGGGLDVPRIRGYLARWSCAGFFNSIMFPNIFALGIAGLGPMTSKGSGLIMTAVVGGAVIPVFIGWLSDNFSYELALVVPMLCYLYIAFYGFAGHKPTRTLPPPVLMP